MTDEHLRALERQWRQTGGAQDEAAYRRALARAGSGASFLLMRAKWWRKSLQASGQVGTPLELLFGGPHSSAPSFTKYGVQPGAWIYVCASVDAQVFVIAGMRVRELVGASEFLAGHELARRHGGQFDRPSCVDEVALGELGSPIELDRRLPPEAVERLRFRSKRGQERGLELEDGKLTRKAVTGLHGHVFRLTESAAAELVRCTFPDG